MWARASLSVCGSPEGVEYHWRGPAPRARERNVKVGADRRVAVTADRTVRGNGQHRAEKPSRFGAICTRQRGATQLFAPPRLLECFNGWAA
jgi:hypothetical protein